MAKKIEGLLGCIYNRKWYLIVHKDFVRTIFTMNSHKNSSELAFICAWKGVCQMHQWTSCHFDTYNLLYTSSFVSLSRIGLNGGVKHTLNSIALQDMPLQGQRFTWCNGQEDPLLARLDSVFFSTTWEDIHPISDLLPLSSNISDHCPLLLSCSSNRPRSYRFRFEHILDQAA
jgi:hypothetical protein